MKPTNSLKIAASDIFKKSLNCVPYYFFLGNSSPWENEQEPPEAKNEVKTHIDVLNDVLCLKRINSEDLHTVIEDNTWISGKVYSQYDDEVDLDKPVDFYVINEEWGVYKCLDNNNYEVSTVMPRGNLEKPFSCQDGYVWVYMYSVNKEDRRNFSGTGYIPCYDTVQMKEKWKNDGSIDRIDIVSGNENNCFKTSPKIIIKGDGYGCEAKAIIKDGKIEKVKIINPGKGYRRAFVEVQSNECSCNTVMRPVVSPVGGHGYNPKEELHAIYKLLDIKLEGSKEGLPTGITYRRIGVVSKGLSNKKGCVVKVTCIRKIKRGQKLRTSSGEEINVLMVDKDNSMFYTDSILSGFDTKIHGEGFTTEIINKINTEHLPLTEEVINKGNYLKNSGNLLWFKNIKPVTRSEEKTEEYKFIVSF
mgnify:CR=1 FL=1|tara:strand:+ start:13847 stop:15097 length:1251 start_codon:yes stop_codon:yes gene_type:complete